MVSPSKRNILRRKTFVNKEEKHKTRFTFPYKPLNKKRFYLDIGNYRGLEVLKRDLISLGGVVEEFLVKEVNYIITTRSINPSSRGSSSENSSIFLPSPNTPNTLYTQSPLGLTPHPPSFHSASCDSPNLDQVSKEDSRQKARTRAEVLLERACTKSKGTSNVTENARLWGIPVWTLSKLLKWLTELKSLPLYQISSGSKSLDTQSPRASSDSQPSKRQMIKSPFVKVEAFNRKYKPHFKELSHWPVINLNCPPGTSPFASPKRTEGEGLVSPKAICNERPKVVEGGNKTKGGYCELCVSNYSDLRLHLQSSSHLAFVGDNGNYRQLDELINEYALNNLGEILYSGPLSKDEPRDNVISYKTTTSSAGSQQEEVKVKGSPIQSSPLVNGFLKPFPAVDVGNGDSEVPKSNLTFSDSNSINESSDSSVSELRNSCSSSVTLHNGTVSDVSNIKTALHSPLASVSETDISSVTVWRSPEKEMVCLIQEPVSKSESNKIRRGASRSKRILSVDSLESSIERSELRKRGLRSRTVSCHSERSDSGHSDDYTNFIVHSDMVDKPNKCRKPKNADALLSEHSQSSYNSGCKLNGEVASNFFVNGVAKLKSRRVSRANSDDSDSVSGTKVNGIDIDNDKVDINLLLEISAKDRKRFESKRAKIKRKNADWMLITETEKYYNEKEEILRNRIRNDSDESDSDASPSPARRQKVKNVENNVDKSNSQQCNEKSVEDNENSKMKNVSSENKVADSKKDKNKTFSPIRSSKKGAKSKSADKKSLLEGKSTVRNEISSKPNRSKKVTLNSVSNIPCSDGENESSYATRNKTVSKKKDHKDSQKPRKRLSDAERFLRDNKEYYQFPETRDRLRRNVNYGIKESEEEQESTYDEASDDSDFEAYSKTKAKKQSTNKCDPKKSSSNRKHSLSKKRHPTKSELSTESKPGKGKRGTVNEDEGIGIKAVERLYFSFEGAPVKESWYQTYQRYIDGAEIDKFSYEADPLRFVLPYEMPKEYFRELQIRRCLLARRRSELADLVRKSPRCHASTLALFSDIIPGKKKLKAQLAKVKTEEVSSDGTSTPGQESSKQSLVEVSETDDELIFVGHCIEQVMNSAIEESLTQAVTGIKKKTPKRNSRKKGKTKKATVHPLKTDKFEFPSSSRLFDNPLALEMDTQFLHQLPTYLMEVNVTPDDTLDKNSLDLLADSCICECTDGTSYDELSSADERTEVSSESVSVCGSETVDSYNSNFPSKFRKFVPFKKRRKNMTGWPTLKKRRPVPLHVSDDNDSSMSFEEHKPKSESKSNVYQLGPNRCVKTMRRYRRASPRKKSNVYYTDTWPVRFRNNSK